MTFLSRLLVVVALSVVMTLILMLIHWEPERSVAPVVDSVTTASPVPVAPMPEPTIQHAADVRSVTLESMLDAGDIEGLPTEIRAALAGCAVPVSPGSPNVISGEFKQPGQTDLAVLCVRGPQAAVYVFWAGHPDNAEVVTEFDFIPATFIRTARATDIRFQLSGEVPIEPGMPLRVRHDGIEVGNGCCATTHYFHRGRWRSYVSAY